MEQHPVPKNVLTVEFKLFGSLTVNQFVRILIGGFAGLGIYALNLNPLIGIPLIVIVVGTFVLSALIKDFQVRLYGILRSLFVSPRYVWRKQESVPDILIDNKAASVKAAAAVAAGKQSNKTIADISLDRLLDARAAAVLSKQPEAEGGTNFDRVYGREYEDEAPPRAVGQSLQPSRDTLAGVPATGQEVRVGPNSSVVVQPVRNTTPRPMVAAAVSEKEQIETDYIESLAEQEIQGLQDKLTELTRQGASPEAKQEVIDRINQLYAGVKKTVASAAPAEQAKKLDPKRMVYGVVVDKKGEPIRDAQVSVFDTQGNQVGPVGISGEDGRFAVENEFASGEYVVSLSHPTYQFLKFKIRVQSDRLPAYRFREK